MDATETFTYRHFNGEVEEVNCKDVVRDWLCNGGVPVPHDPPIIIEKTKEI